MIKIGILTFHRANNYGAILQAYSLYKRIELLDDAFDVRIININYRSRERSDFFKYNFGRFFLRIEAFRNYLSMKKFLKQYIRMTDYHLIDTEEEGIEYINGLGMDVLITGSDEVWKKNEYLEIPNIYWLSPKLRGQRMSCAATANRTAYDKYTDYERAVIKHYLSGYELITIRDDHTMKLVESIVDNKLHYMCDPTFLIDFEPMDIRVQLNRAGVDVRKPIIGFMGGYEILTRGFKEYFGNGYEYVSFYQHVRGTKFVGQLDPLEFVTMFKYCDLVVTSFFHGTVFSIINEKPFLVIEMKDYQGMESKIKHLLKGTELSERYFIRDVTLNMDKMMETAERLLAEDSFDYIGFKTHQQEKFDVLRHKLLSLID